MATTICTAVWVRRLVKSCTCSHLSDFQSFSGINSSFGVLPSCIQSRDMSRHKRRRTHPFRWWAPRKIKFAHQDITVENFKFIKEYEDEKYNSESSLVESPLREPPWPKGEWQPRSFRAGVIARKIGVYPMWTKEGKRILTTLLQVVDNHVIRYSPPEEFAQDQFGKKFKGRYGALVVGAESADPQMFSEAYNGLFKKAGVQTKRKLCKFLVTANAAIQPGTPLNAAHFRVGQYVDVFGKTRGYGFQGVVKRWGMKGGPATHGTTKQHRRVGTVGSGRTMARIWPGKRMPGHMGQERRTLKGLKIWRINTKYNVIWVQGPAVPGYTMAYVKIMDTVLPNKKPTEDILPFPTCYPEDLSSLPEEMYDKDLHQFSDPTVVFLEDTKIKPKGKVAKTAKIAKTAKAKA